MFSNKYLLIFFIIACASSIHSQDVDQISTGMSYMYQSFYDIKTGDTEESLNTEWDIAFTTGGFSVGVLVNESTRNSHQNPYPEVELYATVATDFESTTIQDTTDRLYNDKASWEDGAFNSISDTNNPLDYGWGSYNPSNHVVEGTRVYVIKLRNGDWKKLEIESMAGGVYSFRHANLDGSDEVSSQVRKSDFPNSLLAYYSFDDNSSFTIEPVDWDLVFMRYITPLDAGGGVVLDYAVTGFLSREGVQVAEADGVNPLTVQHDDYQDKYEDRLDIIGHDWKDYNFGTSSWIVLDDRAYFVKRQDGEVWKLYFFDFEGSVSGTASVRKEYITQVATDQPDDIVHSVALYPNPAVDIVQLFLEMKAAQRAQLHIVDTQGKVVSNAEYDLQSGFQSLNVNVKSLLPAIYYIRISTQDGQLTIPFVKS